MRKRWTGPVIGADLGCAKGDGGGTDVLEDDGVVVVVAVVVADSQVQEEQALLDALEGAEVGVVLPDLIAELDTALRKSV